MDFVPAKLNVSIYSIYFVLVGDGVGYLSASLHCETYWILVKSKHGMGIKELVVDMTFSSAKKL